jgi:tripartite motif-containing protein 71
MRNRNWCLFPVLLLALCLVAASSAPYESPPKFLSTWGWGVDDGTGEYQICTSDCRDGDAGDGLGQFASPRGVAVGGSGDVYVVDTNNHRVQKFDESGTFLIEWGVFGAGSGAGDFSFPNGATVDSDGTVYVADTDNHRIQKFNSDGAFLSMWGWGVDDGTLEFQTCNSTCRAGTAGNGQGQFEYPFDVAVDSSGHIYVLDSGNARIQKFDNSGTFLSEWGAIGNGDGQFSSPFSLAIDAADDVYVVESGNYRVQKFDNSGSFLRMWGWGVDDGTDEFQICTGSCQSGGSGAGAGQFNYPYGVAVDPKGNVFVVDNGNQRVQVFGSDGDYLTKWGSAGSNEGQFTAPFRVAIDAWGNVYVVDTNNHRLQKYAVRWLDFFLGEPEAPGDR